MITTYAQLLPPAWAPPTPPTPARWPANSGWNDLTGPGASPGYDPGPSLPPDQPASTETMWWARRRCAHHMATRVGGSGL